MLPLLVSVTQGSRIRTKRDINIKWMHSKAKEDKQTEFIVNEEKCEQTSLYLLNLHTEMFCA